MKKLALAILVGIMCLTATSSYAQKKNLIKGLTEAFSSKATSAVSAQVERQVARATLGAHTIPYASAANIPTATAVLSLERVKAEALHPQMETKDGFSKLLKRGQEWIENARANGLLDYYWSKVEIADVIYNDTDKLARMVKAFYFHYIDLQVKIFPRAKYLKTNETGRIYEIPLKKGLFLEVSDPLNLIPITSEEYVVFKADGENPHLVKRADVELLTDMASYDLTK